MRNRCFLAGLFMLWANAASAQDTGLKALQTGDEASAWQAVGRLDIAGRGFCTGALVAQDLVLTAAHCLFKAHSGERVDASEIEFLAGWRNGRASAYRSVRRTVVHGDYSYGGEVSGERVRNDLALIQLDQPIRNTAIIPFETAKRPARGDQVGIVSYGRDRSEVPALQEVCDVLANQGGVLVTSCPVDFGSSGAPIFTFQDGQAQIVSIVSAKAKVDGENVSFGTELHRPLADLRAELAQGASLFRKALPTASQSTAGQRDRDTGAKFIRPGE